ncbi:MAG: methyltransferase [Synergistes sp.]|nr:methyltransferase [Synergistes sp.]
MCECDNIMYGALKLIQPNEAGGLRVNVDTILLAHFTKPQREEKILEIGCAHGAVSLILAKRGFNVTGIDIQSHLIEMAKENARINGLTAEFRTADIRDYKSIAMPQSCDRIVVNPPYCEEGQSRISPKSALAAAKHGSMVTLEEIIVAAHYILKNRGRLNIIMKSDRLGELFALLDRYKTPPKILRAVYPSCDVNSSVVLVEAMRAGKHGLSVLPPLFIRDENGNETKELKKAYVIEEGK